MTENTDSVRCRGDILLNCALGLAVAIPLNAAAQEQENDTGQHRESANGIVVTPSSSMENERETGPVPPQNATATASRLTNRSRRAFEQGLLSLADYAQHLDAATELRLAHAEYTEDDRARLAALQERSRLLSTAADQLEALNQPAARGWAAEVMQARLLAARAETAAADARGETISGSLAGRTSRLARRHFELRLTDFRRGLADPVQLAEAASHMAHEYGQAPTETALLENYREQLAEIVEGMQSVQERFTGRTHPGRLDFARAELAHVTAHLARASGERETAAAALRESLALAGDAFATEERYYEQGTSDLFTLARIWSYRRSLKKQGKQADLKLDERFTTGLETDLSELQQLADEMRDRRGRHAADITLVRALGELDQWDRFQEEQRRREQQRRPSQSSQQPQQGKQQDAERPSSEATDEYEPSSSD